MNVSGEAVGKLARFYRVRGKELASMQPAMCEACGKAQRASWLASTG